MKKLILIGVVAACSHFALLPLSHAQGRAIVPKKATPEEVQAELKKATAALTEFISAGTWEDAAKFVIDADKLKPQMEAHYERFKWQANEGLNLSENGDALRLGRQVIYWTFTFQMVEEAQDKETGKTFQRPFRVYLNQIGDDYKVDWELYSQRRDLSFEKFMEEQPDDARSFRVNLVRGVPTAAQEKLGLKGSTVRLRAAWMPGSNFPVEIFAGNESEVGKEAEELVSYTNGRPFRIEVKWNKSGKEPFLELLKLSRLDMGRPTVFPVES